MAAKKKQTVRDYFIVNPSGTIHKVNREHGNQRLRQPGYRLATKAEIAKLNRVKGLQTTRKRIAEPWAPEIDDGPDIDALLDGDDGKPATGGEGDQVPPAE